MTLSSCFCVVSAWVALTDFVAGWRSIFSFSIQIVTVFLLSHLLVVRRAIFSYIPVSQFPFSYFL